MPNLEISKIKLGNLTYDIKDEVARVALGSGGTLSNKFGGAEYDSSTQKINFYPDTNNVVAQKLDDVDLSNMSLSLLHLTGTNSSNEPYNIGLSLGEDSDGNPAIVVLNNDPGYSGNEYYYIPILTGETAATLGEVVTNIDYYKSGTTYLLRLFTGASSSTPAKTIDVSDFVKDGMVSNVELTQHIDIGSSYPVLRISFNTDAGKLPIDIPLSGIFNPDNYLDKTEVVTSVNYDTTNGKITYTKNDNAVDVVTLDSSPTSNSKKPVTSGGIYTALSNKADSSSLATVATSGSYNDLSDKPTIPSTAGLATETYVDTAISGLVNSAPQTLDTLSELANALGDDPNFATTVATQIGNKQDKPIDFDTWYTDTFGSSGLPTTDGTARTLSYSELSALNALTNDDSWEVSGIPAVLKINTQSLYTDWSWTYRGTDQNAKYCYIIKILPTRSGSKYWRKDTTIELAVTSSLATVATSGSYNDLSNKPTIPTIGTLNTNNSTAQTASSSESFSGNINLHKVSKTGSYNDLLDKPTIPSAATVAPLMDGTAVVGTSLKYAKEDHIHPSDTSRVPTTRTINNKPLSSDITLTASDVNADVFIVHIEDGENEDEYTCDKTNAEIYAAWQAGRNIIAMYQFYAYPIASSNITSTYAAFTGLLYDDPHGLDSWAIRVINNRQVILRTELYLIDESCPCVSITNGNISAWNNKSTKVIINMSYDSSNDTVSFTDVNNSALTHTLVINLLNNSTNDVLILYKYTLHRTYGLSDGYYFYSVIFEYGVYSYFSLYNNNGTLILDEDTFFSVADDNTVVHNARKVNGKTLASDINTIVYGQKSSTGFRVGTYSSNTNTWAYASSDTTLSVLTIYFDNSTGKAYTYNGKDLKEFYSPNLSNFANINGDTGEDFSMRELSVNDSNNAGSVNFSAEYDSNSEIVSLILADSKEGESRILPFNVTQNGTATIMTDSDFKTINNLSIIGSGNITINSGSPEAVVDVSANNANGNLIFTKANGNTITADLNHTHSLYLTAHQSLAGYAKYVLCLDETEYNNILEKDSNTLYLIPES